MTRIRREAADKMGSATAMPSRGRLLGAVVAGFVALMAGASWAQMAAATAPAPRSSLGRPDANTPTQVFVTIWVADIDSIDSANQSYVANVFVALRWSDPRLAHMGDGPRVYDLNGIWDPRAIVANEIGMVRRTLPEVAEVSPDGNVIYRQRYVGVFSQALRLEDFPLDSHVLRFHLASPGWAPDDVHFVPDDRWTLPNGPRAAAGAGIAEEISLPDWDIEWCRARAMPYVTAGPQAAGYALEFEARRHRGYFYWKLLLPLTLIILMSWLVFWIDPTNSGTQIGVATTAMLTLIAYRFALDQSVPRVGYLTRMDYFVMGSSVLVFLALCQVVLTAHLAKTNRLKLAQRLDAWSRLVFLLLLAGLMIGSFVI
jgi:hypothetical protein